MADSVVPLLIDGKEVTTSTTFEIVSPSTGEKQWDCASASTSDAIAAVEAAVAAFPSWSKTKPTTRRDMLLRAADIMTKRAAEGEKFIIQETSMVEQFGKFNTETTVAMIIDVAGRISSALQGEVPICQQEGAHAMLVKEPYGVVLGIAPWNAPFILGVRSFLFAIATGNTVVMKGSELSPKCFWYLGSVFKEAGLPAGVLNIVYHRPQDAAEVTKVLIEHPAVKKVNFTGSTPGQSLPQVYESGLTLPVGSIIASIAGKNLKPVLMELGGKASAIVCADADIELAARECALGAFLSSGQICMSTERVLVQKGILEPFRTVFLKTIEAIFPANSPAVLVQSAGVEKNKHLIADAIAKGATISHGDPAIEHSSKTRMAPIVIEGVQENMDIFRQESFGPTVSLITFETEEEAIAIANDTEYGLTSAVFTENLGTGLRIARQIESGSVFSILPLDPTATHIMLQGCSYQLHDCA